MNGKIYDRQAWFQIIPVGDMVTEKSTQGSQMCARFTKN